MLDNGNANNPGRGYYFNCLQRGGCTSSIPVPLKVKGGSRSIDDEDRSFVGRSLITNA